MENNRHMVGTDMDVLPFVVKMRHCITVILIAINHKMASIKLEVKTKMIPKGVRRERWTLRRFGAEPGMCT
jgi:vacuolar-type H+-ATPase subunit C/Vma6